MHYSIYYLQFITLLYTFKCGIRYSLIHFSFRLASQTESLLRREFEFEEKKKEPTDGKMRKRPRSSSVRGNAPIKSDGHLQINVGNFFFNFHRSIRSANKFACKLHVVYAPTIRLADLKLSRQERFVSTQRPVQDLRKSTSYERIS